MGIHLGLGRLSLGGSLGEDLVDFVLGSDRVLRQILNDEGFVVAFEQLELHPRLDVVAVRKQIEKLFVVEFEVGDADGELGACE